MSSNPTAETRQIVAERQANRCMRCGVSLYGKQASLHHRRMRSHPFDGLHEPYNLIWLCGSGTTGCHGYVHARPKEAYENGWLVHSYENPQEVCCLNYRNEWELLEEAQ